MPGRITFADEGRALVAGDVAIGAGWGTTPGTLAIAAGSNSQRGTFTVTCGSGSLAQATATLVVTFPKAFDNVPFAQVTVASGGTAAVTKFWIATATATTLTLTFNTLPVAAETHIVNYLVIP